MSDLHATRPRAPNPSAGASAVRPPLGSIAGVLLGAISLTLGLVGGVGAQATDNAAADSKASTADHSKFEQLQGPFASGPDVTKACLGCHTEAAKQVHKSIHWTWEYTNPATGQLLGKKHVACRSESVAGRLGKHSLFFGLPEYCTLLGHGAAGAGAA